MIRDGWIVAAGPDVTPPPGARVWDCKGQVIYPGFIDALAPATGAGPAVSNDLIESGARSGTAAFTATGGPYFGVAADERPRGASKTGSRLGSVSPEHRVSEGFAPDAKYLGELREIGFTAANFAPERGIYRGWAAAFNLGDRPPAESLLRDNTSQVAALEATRGDHYPNSLMGAISVLRQVGFDAKRQAGMNAGDPPAPGAPRPAHDASLEALRPVTQKRAPLTLEPGSALLESRGFVLAAELDFPLHLVASGEEWRRPDLLRPAIAAGVPFIVPVAFPSLPKLPEDDAWDAVDLDRLRAWDWAPENPALLRKAGAAIALTTHGLPERKSFRANLRAAIDRGLAEADALEALTAAPARLLQLDATLGTIAPGKLANLTITEAGGYFSEDARVVAVWIDGEPYLAEPEVKPRTKPEEKPSEASEKAGEKADKDEKGGDKKKKELRELAARRAARAPRETTSANLQPPALWISSVTLWTSGPKGILTNASLVAVGGRIVSVGPAPDPAALPGGTLRLDLPGATVTAGIIDCHSHSMILGAVNETGAPSTAACRIGDVVNSEAATIHQQLAGGVTTVNLLHGSANPIGGQNCVIKLRDGAGPDAMKFTNAPQGIKFALGENVKQSNWGDKFTTRYPQSRMGVPAFYVNRFTAAQQYRDEWRAWNQGGQKSPAPRRDLELEALAEILDGSRLIHCHSYRQDEILAFLRTMEGFGVRVATLQHILEGYKVADEIAAHGAGASTFADWWSYKYEVIDAIPYAASLMRDRGVLVSVNSDSNDHARRLNFEAAKAVKYGGTPPEEALKFVTINPAKQLRIDAWVGSLEPGKDADFAIWSGDPLDSSSVCLQTWVDGVRFFNRADEGVRNAALEAERVALVAKARKLSGGGGGGPAGKAATPADQQLFFRQSLETAERVLVECQDANVDAP